MGNVSRRRLRRAKRSRRCSKSYQPRVNWPASLSTRHIAFLNLDRAEAVLCQISDSQTYVRTIQKLEVYSPTQILISNTALKPLSKLATVIDNNGERLRTEVVVVDRKYWNEKAGMDMLENLAFTDDLDNIKVSLSGNYYAVCCFSAVSLPDDFATLLCSRRSPHLNTSPSAYSDIQSRF